MKENIRETLEVIGTGKEFLQRILTAQEISARINNWYCLHVFCCVPARSFIFYVKTPNQCLLLQISRSQLQNHYLLPLSSSPKGVTVMYVGQQFSTTLLTTLNLWIPLLVIFWLKSAYLNQFVGGYISQFSTAITKYPGLDTL